MTQVNIVFCYLLDVIKLTIYDKHTKTKVFDYIMFFDLSIDIIYFKNIL